MRTPLHKIQDGGHCSHYLFVTVQNTCLESIDYFFSYKGSKLTISTVYLMQVLEWFEKFKIADSNYKNTSFDDNFTFELLGM